jgi:hypothetical protein
MYIEDCFKPQPKPEGLALDIEFSVRKIQLAGHGERHAVYQRRVGTVFVGSEAEAREYVKQARAKQAVKRAEAELAKPSAFKRTVQQALPVGLGLFLSGKVRVL